ncbi:XkdF-like putative serine protease domain-containing protein [Oceanobacillus sp. CF4.6]|uniref:XkdF-like putative serine protease domain-containing protein n=1 Tax=Oceanobacillus sp. CF4.6 TaxID=3373080 RepID=UPI003EE76226
MPRELINANITHVSYVDKGANNKQFFFTKSNSKGEPDFQKEVKVFVNKDDDEQQLVYGLVYEPDVEDSHGDFMTPTEIEKAAHVFMKDARNIDKQHDFNSGVGEVVESYIAPADFEIGEESITKGSWILVTKANDEIWEDIKKGDITGYSMAGTAEIIEKEENKSKKEPASKSHENEDDVKGFFNTMKSFFSGEKIQKGEVRDNYERNQKRRNLWAVWDGLENVYYDSLWDNRTPDIADFERLEEGTKEFLEILQEIKNPEDVQKALDSKEEHKRKDEDEVKKEDIEKMLDDKLGPISKRLDGIEKEEGDSNEPGEGDIMKQFSDILDNKLGTITERLETVEKARGISKQADVEEVTNENKDTVQKGYMRHFG